MNDQIILTPIGVVFSAVEERTDCGWGDVVARVGIKPGYAGAFTGIESFSHAIVVTYLHETKFDPARHIKRRPQGREDMPEVGMFAQRAKNRPNPIGITAVEILAVAEDALTVKGLDAIDGTPVIDIKPYYPHYDRIDSPRVPSWVDTLMKGYF